MSTDTKLVCARIVVSIFFPDLRFLTQGNITDRGYAPVQVTKASENVIGNDVGETKTSVRPNHKHDVCEFWESIGVDQRWWWIN